MHTIIGAGGIIADELANILIANNQPVKLVSRHPVPRQGAITVAADATNYPQTAEAIKGSSIVYLCVGLPYDIKVWKAQWPLIMQHTINACKQHQAKLIFFDNVYALGKVTGPMTEDTPFNPCSKKGEVRAAIATSLLDEIKAGNVQGLIARSADFYGPNCRSSAFNLLVTDRMAKGKKGQFMANADLPHSFTYTPDCGRALWLLSSQDYAWNTTWNIPTARPALTGKEMIAIAAKAFNTGQGLQVMSKSYIRFGGLFNKMVRELYEMLYQNEFEYIFDSTRFENAFGIKATSYEEGIRQTVLSYKN